MERKEALKYIQSKISEGIPKHLIYKELKDKVRYQTDQLSYLSEIPDLNVQNENRLVNSILAILLGFILLVQLSISFLIIMGTANALYKNIPFYALGGWIYILAPIFLIFIIKDILKFRKMAYRYVFFLTIFAGIYLNILISSFTLWLVFFSPWIIATILSFYIIKKAFPYDGPFKGFNEKRFKYDLDNLLENSKEN